MRSHLRVILAALAITAATAWQAGAVVNIQSLGASARPAALGNAFVAIADNGDVDTLLITGCSTSACVRATATDARGYRFRPIVPRQCVQDRSPAAHEYNLFDIDAKFGDVIDLEDVLAYLKGLETA